MKKLTDIPIRGKLMLVTGLASIIALLLAGSILIAYETLTYRDQKTREVSVQAEIIAASVTASLAFNDRKAAQEYLNALKANPEIAAAGVYGADGVIFASYARPGTAARPLPAEALPEGRSFEGDQLAVFQAVKEGPGQIGTVYLRATIEPLAARLARYGAIMLVVMLGSLVLTLPASMRLHATIANPISEIAGAARQIATGDLTAKLSVEPRADEIGVLVEAFRQMLDRLREMTREIAIGVSVLPTTSSDIMASAAQISSGSVETAAVVSQTSATVEEVKRTAQLSSEKARHVAENAQRTALISQGGKKLVEDTFEAMQRIQEQMESIAEAIVRLSEQGQAIGEIIATVNDLAEQSNLLAVNAAIEAAKAGEQGKGFAVVAQEVRSLAVQSKQATAQVRSILGDIRKATSGAVMATEQGSRAVEAGVKLSRDVGESIRILSENIDEAARSATQIAASAQQQQVGMDQVALAMRNINQASTQNVASTRQAETAAQNLHGLGQKLKQLVEQYRV